MTALTFVGIGAIGLPMAARLQSAGYSVTGIDPMATARDRAAAVGITATASIIDAARADVVIVMVATPDQLATLLDQAGDTVRDQTWVIMSTVGPDAIKVQAERLVSAGARVVDAPVTGGATRAATGELVIFTSGLASEVEDVSSILSMLGTVRVVGGRIGDGQSVKIVNQHLCSIHIVAAAEALSLADSLGLDRASVLELVAGGAAGSWMLSDRGPRMLGDTDVAVMSTINIFVKDSGLVASAADRVGAEVPLLRAAEERYRRAADGGLGARDDSRVVETYAR
ncbi:MAG: NAD(P)-dependent oxidoreductase [Kineosporiaceae bacterium]|nr:NAD(P)-dependent oxidoreductase [Aeromicrobium sp.]